MGGLKTSPLPDERDRCWFGCLGESAQMGWRVGAADEATTINERIDRLISAYWFKSS